MSLPLRGEWIEIPSLASPFSMKTGLSPCGESGLKLFHLSLHLPLKRLSPCGESGLKFVLHSQFQAIRVSLPLRGEWIEIF